MTNKPLEILANCSASRSDQIVAALQTVRELHSSREWFVFEYVKCKDESVRVSVYSPTQEWIGDFKLEPFPGINNVIVSTQVVIEEKQRGKGWGRLLNRLRVRAMSLAGYSRMLATVRNDNLGEEHILETNGWKRLTTFDSNLNASGEVSLWERIL